MKLCLFILMILGLEHSINWILFIVFCMFISLQNEHKSHLIGALRMLVSALILLIINTDFEETCCFIVDPSFPMNNPFLHCY